MKNESDLKGLRAEIDKVDHAIIRELTKRKKLEQAIGAYKRAHGMKLLDAKRRHLVLRSRAVAGKTKGLQPELVRKLFALIHTYSLSTQKNTKL